ncbi:MAG TPA: tetratricopeptide repeat protein [Candidatus Sulfotelmatobacter sp.]|nr:tetratricopeptide repeat protein [Candidatus Sulfotelmatobacter sp.]
MESHDAAATFMLKLWPWIETNKNKLVTGTAIVLVIVLGFFLYFWRRDANRISAGDAVTQNMLTLQPNSPPATVFQSYMDVASDYPNTPAGERALLQAATIMFTQGKYPDSQHYFQQYLDTHPDGQFSGIAALGVAKSLEAEGKINDAEGAYNHVINDFATDGQSVNRARFCLALLNLQQGRYQDAFSLFQTVYQADQYGPLGGEARNYLVELQSKLPRQPSTAPSAAPSPSFNLSH